MLVEIFLKGDTVAKINSWGLTVLKWRDRQDVLIISTKYINTSIINIVWTGKIIKNLKVVVDYNARKVFIDLIGSDRSDRVVSYISTKTFQWYRKLIIYLIYNTPFSKYIFIIY